jgi:hypothetical protein
MEEEICELKRENAELKKAVKNQPMLADGVPVHDHQEVFTIIDGKVVQVHMRVSAEAQSGWIQECPSTLNGSIRCHPCDCYSTKRAAEKAQKE